MHALCLVTEAYGGRGGIARSTRDLVAAFAEDERNRGIEVVARFVRECPSFLPRGVKQNVSGLSRPGFALAAAIAAVRCRPQLVFCNHLHLAPLAASVAALVDAKLVIQLHGIEIWTPPSRAQFSALRAATRLWCVSRDTRDRVMRYCNIPPERVVVINNMVGEEFTPGDRARARTRFGVRERFCLLTVSRLDPRERYKGHENVMRIVPELLSVEPSLMYLIAGAGEDRSRLERIAASLGIEQHIRFLGRVPDPELPDLYRAADLFVLASAGEGFGIVFVEAMACGTPTVGLGIGGARDALADGVLGDCVQLDALGQTLRMRVTEIRASGHDLAQDVRRRFGHEAFTNRVRDALSAVLEG